MVIVIGGKIESICESLASSSGARMESPRLTWMAGMVIGS